MTSTQPDPSLAVPVGIGPAVERSVELSRTQSLIWASQLLHPDQPLANMAHRVTMSGLIDADRFVAAVDAVVAHSDVLRLVVDSSMRGGVATGTILRRPPQRTEVVDVDFDRLDDWCAQRIAQPVDATSCVYDSVLIRHTDDRWTWWMDVHHVASDAWSSALVIDATARAYRALGGVLVDGLVDGLVDRDRADDLLAIDGEYFGGYQRRSDRAAEELPSGDRNQAGLIATPAISTPAISTSAISTSVIATAVEQFVVLDADADADRLAQGLEDDFRSLSRELSALALSAMAAAVTLWRTDGRSTVIVGVPVHHRSERAAKRVVGPLMEVHPLEVTIDESDTARTMFSRVLRSIIVLLRQAQPGTSPAGRFDVVVNSLVERMSSFDGMPTEVTWVRADHVDPSHPLRLHIFDHSARANPAGDHHHGTEERIESAERRLRWTADVNIAFGDSAERGRLVRWIGAALTSFVDAPDAPIATIALLDDDDRAELALLNPQPAPRDELRPVHEQISDQLAALPDQVVAEHGGVTITASEFDLRADSIARRLVAEGVEVGDRIGIKMDRGIDVLVAVQGVLRAGATFVMMSPDDPPDRLASIESDAELVRVIDRHSVSELLAVPMASVDLPSVSLDDGAYVLYTSGSTGTPKGVPISHRGMADYLEFALDAYVRTAEPDTDLVVALHSSLVFDLTLTSMQLGLLGGGSTVIFDGAPVDALGAVSRDHRITFLKATPSQLELVTRMATGPLPFRTVVVGGEAFRRPVAERFADQCLPGVRIFNEYGPTEAVVGCMIHQWNPSLDDSPDVPIGAASPGCQIAVLDDGQRPTLPGAWGELYVRRPGMAQRYLNLTELSAERFVRLDDVPGVAVDAGTDDAVVDGDLLWYRTGDRVRSVRAGVLIFGGRLDDQLKVGGIRLEPAEVEVALVEHAEVRTAIVGLWNPAEARTAQRADRCVRCGLGTDVPGVRLDGDRICNVCHDFDNVREQADAWFGDEDDLQRLLLDARRRATGEIDCLHLLSGGKDSTYALYQLVDRGWRVHALTLDNGFISDGAKANIRRSIDDLGITHEFVTTESMNEIFRDSLDRYANVCQGCYKTIYTLAVARANELGIPTIVTGLSRGQFFETRLVPHQFENERFDADEIDATVIEARRVYHHTDDAVTRLLPEQRVFDDPGIFERIEFVDFYRYVDVDLAGLYEFLDTRAPWVRPDDTGRSTNCLINIAGIAVHRAERGFHNYAEPYSWDVRLGHKTRDEALEELDDEMDRAEIERLLHAVGYEPKTSSTLTAWYQSTTGRDIDPAELRAHLRDRLPAHAVPSAFVRIDELPFAASAKVDASLLPAPTRFHRSAAEQVAPTTEVERRLCEVWSDLLGLESVGITDDFFDLGGASLTALEAVAIADDLFGTDLPDAAVFRSRTVRELAVMVELARTGVRGAPGRNEIAPVDPTVPLPLSAGEEAMLFEQRMDPGSVRYNVTRLHTVDGPLDIDRVKASFEEIVALHAPLVTSYAADRRRLDLADALLFEELEQRSATDFRRFADEQRAVPFDLENGPLVRVHLAATGPLQTSVLIGLHHVGVDAGSFDVLWSQVGARYAGRELPVLPTSYAAHGAWQRAQRRDAARAFWLGRAAARPAPAPLAVAAPAAREADGYLSRVVDIGPDAFGSVGGTRFSAAVAAAAVAFSNFTDGDDVEFGITASTKDHADAAPLVGYFLNTVPIVVPVGPTSSFGDVAASASDVVTSLLEHRTYPFAEIVRDARAAELAVPDVSLMLAHEVLHPPRLDADGDLGEVADVSMEILASGEAVADATLFVQEAGDVISVGVEYRGAVIGREDAQRLLDVFERSLVAGLADPGQPLAAVLSPALGADLIGARLPESSAGVLDLIVKQMIAAPEAVAVVDSDGAALSYGQLAVSVARLVEQLTQPVGELRHVGVLVERSVGMVAALLAAQFAGAAYVPLDPSLPPERLKLLATETPLDAVLVGISSADRFDVARAAVVDAAGRSVPVVQVDGALVSDVDDVVGGDDSDDYYDSDDAVDKLRECAETVAADDLAYVISTSGSTGRPRTIGVTHGNLASSTAARASVYETAPSRFLLTSSIGFDSSVVGLFWTLTAGGEIVVPGDDVVHDVDGLGALIEERSVTHLLMVPTLYSALLRRASGRLGSLTTAIVAGEAGTDELIGRHHDVLPGVALFNEYGPSEATVWASVARLGRDDAADLIGGAIPGTVLRVASNSLQPVPDGVGGELLISGPGVTSGYRNDDDATAERFVVTDGRRWYRSGDRVRATADGLVFLGRVDDQLNVGGSRVEPAEIETQLTRLDGVVDAVVVAADDRLVAHLVPSEPGARLADDDLRRALAVFLPAALIPSRFVRHDRLPLTTNGKVDRRLLAAASTIAPEPVPEQSPPSSRRLAGAGAGAGRAALAEQIVEVWSAVFERADIDMSTDFFEIGGNSLTAVEIVSRLGDALGGDVRVGALLAGRTPAGLAAQIDSLSVDRSQPVSGGVAVDATVSSSGEDAAFPIVVMQPGTNDGPLVLLTPAWDSVFGYQQMAEAFPDDHTVLALAYVEVPDREVITTVRVLVDEVVPRVAPAMVDRSPIAVVGWSVGGVVAVELAERLTGAGRSVDVVALVDTFFPGEARHIWSNRWWKYKSMLRPGHLGDAFDEFGRMGRLRLRRLSGQIGRRFLAWSGQTIEQPSGPKRTSENGFPVDALMHEFGSIDNPLVLFRASTTNPERTLRRWEERAAVDDVVIEGRHRGLHSVMAADRVGEIVDDIVARLTR